MTRIDFYFNADSRLQFACKIVAKALRQKLRVAIFSKDDVVSRTLDKLMWSSPPTVFTPHCTESDILAEETPVLFIRDMNVVSQRDLLVNLDLEPPPLFSRFPRLIEIVSRDDKSDQLAARVRFRFYRDRGYALSHHDLTQTRTGSRSG